MTDLASLAHAARNRIDRVAMPNDVVCRFSVLGKPIPKGSMRTGVSADGRSYAYSDQPNLSRWTHDVFWSAKAAFGTNQLEEGPVECLLDFVLPVPKSREGELWPSQGRTGDLDKLTRAILDGLTGSIWKDDCQVVRLLASKRFANSSLERHQGVTVTVYRLSG
jgi:crossover junction endodeoxyribonuclease RusA